MTPARLILLTGATGYIGGRLVPRLLKAGYRVRCLARDPARLEGRDWLPRVQVVEGDCLQPETLPAAVEGVDAAFYLVHSMAGGHDFEERDLVAARNFAAAAKTAGVDRIIYLGGLGDAAASGLSDHLRSRQATGDALRETGVPVTEFRAAVIVGSGSLSFEIIRCLAERVPVMICPKWVFTRVQPIAIRNVLDYLVAALETPESAGRVIEIGGADVTTYGGMLTSYARVRELRRWLVPVPLLTPRLSSFWVHLVTPVPAAIARPLIEGLRNDVVVCDHTARRLFPQIELLDYAAAVRLALENLDRGGVKTAWSDAMMSSQGDAPPVQLSAREGVILERRQCAVPVSPESVYRTFTRLGGATGWLCMNWAWQLRGALDRALGGVGMRRGRRDPQDLRVGEAVDFWRVEAVESNRLLRLRAEMKVPGRAWLEFRVEPQPEGGSLLSQTAFFAPRGLAGLLYWYALYPMHALIFRGLIKRLARNALAAATAPCTSVRLKSDNLGGRATLPDGVAQAKPATAETTGGLKSIFGLAGWLALCFGAAAVGAQFMPGEWYASLRKPAWNPPSCVFGPVWSALYTMMAFAAWLVWKRAGFKVMRLPLGLFLLQLFFNALWSPLFFGLHNPALGFAVITLLWLSLLGTVVVFYRVHAPAGLLLVPYLAWVTFAAALNWTLWRLNT